MSIPSYDWASFLGERFRKVPQMKSYHHFFFSGRSLGSVVLKQFSDSDSSSFKMLIDNSWIPSPRALPPVISPSGLPCARQWYLYNEIREFCRDRTRDLTLSVHSQYQAPLQPTLPHHPCLSTPSTKHTYNQPTLPHHAHLL